LTREAANDAIDGNSICSETFSGKLFDIFIAGNLGPVLLEHASAERIDLAERDGLETARPLQTKVEAADSGKEAKHAKHHANPRVRFSAASRRFR
jgi:hypothetical protein